MNDAQLRQAKQLCQYVRNTGQVPLAIHDFDDDHCPAGEMARDFLVENELIEIRDQADDELGGIYLTDKGRELL